jgi:hypothetical protein
MEREDLKYIRSMKLSNDRREDWTAKCRRDRRLFLLILTVLVVALATILVMGGFKWN